MSTQKAIGIIGGMGPDAGIDLIKKITANTPAQKDSDHIEIYLLSRPSIPDRTSYLLDNSNPCPTQEILNTAKKLIAIGATHIAMSCNTAHSDSILTQEVLDYIRSQGASFVHIIHETAKHLQASGITTIGLLATKGTYFSGVYQSILSQYDIETLLPSEQDQELVHDYIYNPKYGVKSIANPPHSKALDGFDEVGDTLLGKGATHIIGGCTEISVVRDLLAMKNIFIDPNEILAKSLIQTYCK